MVYHIYVLKKVLMCGKVRKLNTNTRIKVEKGCTWGPVVSELWFTWTIKVDFPCQFGPGTPPLWVPLVNSVNIVTKIK